MGANCARFVIFGSGSRTRDVVRSEIEVTTCADPQLPFIFCTPFFNVQIDLRVWNTVYQGAWSLSDTKSGSLSGKICFLGVVWCVTKPGASIEVNMTMVFSESQCNNKGAPGIARKP